MQYEKLTVASSSFLYLNIAIIGQGTWDSLSIKWPENSLLFFCAWMALQFQKCENKLREKLGPTKVRYTWTLDLNVRFTISGIYANGLHCRTWPGGATVARLTPVQKVACSNHVRVTIFFCSSFVKSLICGKLENSPYLIHILELRFTGLSLRIQRIQKMWKSHRSALR